MLDRLAVRAGEKGVLAGPDSHPNTTNSPGFLTGSFQLQRRDGTSYTLHTVYIPTNHLYVGDVAFTIRGRHMTPPRHLKCFRKFRRIR